MNADLPALFSDKIFENKSAEDTMSVLSATLAFHLHYAVSTEGASLLFRFDFLKMNTVSKAEIRSEPFQHIWFTSEGERIANEFSRVMAEEIGVSEVELKAKMPDFIEDAISDFNVFGVSRNGKFLMHRYRLEKELAGSWERRKAIAEIYAVWF